MGTKNIIRKWTKSVKKNPILWEREWSRFVRLNSFERFVTRLQTDLVPRFVRTSDTKLGAFRFFFKNCKRISHAAQLLLHLANKYFQLLIPPILTFFPPDWGMLRISRWIQIFSFNTVRILQYMITSAGNAAAIAKGMIELRSIVFHSKEERGRWRQGLRCLRCLKLRM